MDLSLGLDFGTSNTSAAVYDGEQLRLVGADVGLRGLLLADEEVATVTHGTTVVTNAMLEGRSDAFRQHFLGTHFFNPPRFMRLVEVIPSADTLPAVLADAEDVIGRVLGKGIVKAKDTPNFIGNRIGAFTSCLAIRLALEGGYTVEEVDVLTGPLIGRPRTGTFRLSDLVGLDTSYHVRRNVYQSLPGDPDRDRLWQLADRNNSGRYTQYQKNPSRAIPVVVLTPR